MPRLQQLFECIGSALCVYATAALARLVPFETALLEVAKETFAQTSTWEPAEIRVGLREIVSSPAETVELAVQDALMNIRPEVPEEFRESLLQYLEMLPEICRQALRRPGDMEGISVPQQFQIRRAEDWLLLLPDRLPTFRPGDLPPGVDNWRVESLRGVGPHSEVWEGYDDEQPEISPACLKFVTDSRLGAGFRRYESILRRVLDLDVNMGLIPLRSAFLQSGPPCLEYVQLHGYDLANLMHDARWRDDRPRPEQAAMIARRLARISGKLHQLDEPMVHRGLKPSNVLLSPTTEGNVSVWVSDIGWGEITAPLANQHLEVSQALRRSLRGSYSALYASPQLKMGMPPDPRDDVYSIGMIWYQLLMRDPSLRMPHGTEWSNELRRYGFTDTQASLVMSCLAENPNDRPANGFELADLIASNTNFLRANESGTIRLQGSAFLEALPKKMEQERPRLYVRPDKLNPDEM